MMNRSPSPHGSVGDLDFAGLHLSYSLAMEPMADPERVPSLQDGQYLNMRFEAGDFGSSPFASVMRLDWIGSRALLPDPDLHLTAAFGGLMAGGVTKPHDAGLPPPLTLLPVANASGEAGSNLAATMGTATAEPDGALNQATDQAAQDTEVSVTFRLLTERLSITLAQMADAPQARMPDGSKGLSEPLLDETFDYPLTEHFLNTDSIDAVWNAW